MLSIIVLNYNRRELSKKTIHHLKLKTTVPHELILVDNGSIDGTREYLETVTGNANTKRVIKVFNKSNFGVAGGRNSGLKEATGDYLMTIDDDILVPDEYDVKLIEACTKIERLGITGINVESKRYPVKEVDGVKMQIKSGNLGGGCLFMRRDVFDQVGFYSPDFVYGGEDCDMYIRIKRLRLRSMYIEPMGKHIDPRSNKAYEALKRFSHSAKSKAYQKVGDNELKYKRTNKVYIPYKEPKIVTQHFDDVITAPILKKEGQDGKKTK